MKTFRCPGSHPYSPRALIPGQVTHVEKVRPSQKKDELVAEMITAFDEAAINSKKECLGENVIPGGKPKAHELKLAHTVNPVRQVRVSSPPPPPLTILAVLNLSCLWHGEQRPSCLRDQGAEGRAATGTSVVFLTGRSCLCPCDLCNAFYF